MEALNDIEVAPITGRPIGYRRSAYWEHLELCERGALPVGMAKDDGYHPSLTHRMALHSSFQFDAVSIIARNEVRTDEEKYNVRRIKVLVNLLLPFAPCIDIPVVPVGDQSVAVQSCEMSLQFPQEI